MVRQRVDIPTIVGLGMALVVLLTMWHEIGGHAAACIAQGGHVATIGAFYVDCTGLGWWPELVIACAGVFVNAVLAGAAYLLWRNAQGDRARLILWLVWVSEGFVAAGYFCFSGATGFGDLGTDPGGGLAGVPMPLLWRVGEFVFGVAAYIMLVRAAIGGLTTMLGDSHETAPTRRHIAHVYYATAGLAAVVVGLMNPVGIVITIMSAAASSFGGLAGFISIGFAAPHGETLHPFSIDRSWPIIVSGILLLGAFAAILGPSITFPA